MHAFISPLNPPYEPEVADELSRLMGGSEREPLLLFACNGPGTVCSPGQKVPVCGKRRK